MAWSWRQDPDNKFFQAMGSAVTEEWGMKPDLIREGGTMPVASYLERELEAPALLLPLGQSMDRAHMPNERLRLQNLMKGKDVLANWLLKLGESKVATS